MRVNLLTILILTINSFSCREKRTSTDRVDTLHTASQDTFHHKVSSFEGTKDFDKFLMSISRANNYYVLGDTLTSQSPDLGQSVDTQFLTKYHLIDTTSVTLYKPRTLSKYNCILLGQYNYNGMHLLLTSSVRTEAGDGNPIFSFISLSEKGEFLDALRVDINYAHDPEINPTTYFSISRDFIISVNQKVVYSKIEDDRLVKTDSTSAVQRYMLDKSGHFVSDSQIRK